MATRLISPILLTLVMVFSCAEDEGAIESTKQLETANDALKLDSIPTLNLDSTFQHCDSIEVATSHGTACCISGPTVAKPGDIFRYHYQMNRPDAHVSWEIAEGDISIIAGQDTHTVTVQFGPNFVNGFIRGLGNNKPEDFPRMVCNDRVTITSD